MTASVDGTSHHASMNTKRCILTSRGSCALLRESGTKPAGVAANHVRSAQATINATARTPRITKRTHNGYNI